MEKRREKGLTFDTDSQWEKVKRKKSVLPIVDENKVWLAIR